MKISIIAAMGDNRVIGAQGKIPWHLPADFKKFKELTMGHPVIMGNKTFESIGKPLPGRTNIILAKDPDYAADGCLISHSLDDAIALAKEAEGSGEVFIGGGGQVYALALPMTDTIYLTKVHGVFEGDTFFPEFDESQWKLVNSEERQKDEKNSFDLTWLTYGRKK
jgi:dihydrofolate reductase